MREYVEPWIEQRAMTLVINLSANLVGRKLKKN